MTCVFWYVMMKWLWIYLIYPIWVGIDENDVSIKVSITRGMNRGFSKWYANANPNVTEMLN